MPGTLATSRASIAEEVPQSPAAAPPASDWAQTGEPYPGRRVRPPWPSCMPSFARRDFVIFCCETSARTDLDDKVHDCFVIVTQAIQNGVLREPERLMGYVRTVVKRQIAASIDVRGAAAAHARGFRGIAACPFPTGGRIPSASSLRANGPKSPQKCSTSGVAPRPGDPEPVYVLEQSQEEICAAMGLTYNPVPAPEIRGQKRVLANSESGFGRVTV